MVKIIFNYISIYNLTVYGLVGCSSIILSSFVAYIYGKYERKTLGKRVTFNLIMKLLNIFDLLVSIMIFIHIAMAFVETHYAVSAIYVSIVYFLMATDIAILTLMAFDRYLAVNYPTTTRWTAKILKISFFSIMLFLGLLEIVARVVIFLVLKSAYLVVYLYRFYAIYGLTMLIVNAVSYLRLFAKFYYQSRKLSVEQRNTRERVRLTKIIKFGRYLFLINVSYMLFYSIIIIINLQLIKNLPFWLYNTFYFIVLINPIIFIYGNKFMIQLITKAVTRNKTAPSSTVATIISTS